jgi:adenylate cyclase
MPAAKRKAKRVGDLALWLAEHEGLALTDLHDGFCRELLARGVPLWRSSLGLELLHPEQSGVRSLWSVDAPVKVTQAPRGVETTPAYLNSPVRIIDETERPFRQKLTETIPDLPILMELKEAGGTDYMIFPLPFLDRARSSYLSYTTAAPKGFASADFKLLETATRLISPYAERRALRRMAIDLLDTYVGHHAGARIFNGQILRGAVDTIEAAILMCDLRGFTVLSKKHERDVVIETLNAWFDGIAVAVEAHGGEILKFMGDGLLAIFRADPDISEACLRAFAAALDAQTSISTLNAERRSKAPPIGFAMGLHVGEVAYGNVGGRTRLDFTVLGPAVNYASRLQDLAKRLGQSVLVSRDFANAVAGEVVELGTYPLRGIGKAEQVFALPAAA